MEPSICGFNMWFPPERTIILAGVNIAITSRCRRRYALVIGALMKDTMSDGGVNSTSD